MRLKLLRDFLNGITNFRKNRKYDAEVNRLREIVFSNPTTPEGFNAQREAIKQLNLLERDK